jgi:hypothetical protein
MISEKRAKEIAAAFHSGQWSPLYALSSSGYIDKETLRDIDAAMHECDNQNDIRRLRSLREFAAHTLETVYRQNADGDRIAAKFLQRKTSGTSHTTLINGHSASRLVTDGNAIFSYEWWKVAYWIDESSIAVTTDNYRYPNSRGKMITSPTTAAHVGSAHYAVIAAGFVPTDETREEDSRTFRVYVRG